MSIVRYTNKKTGWVGVYESTSYYDPVTKSSRPRRKYIGHEDPVTGEFIPSNGEPGRRKKSVPDDAAADTAAESLREELAKKDLKIQRLVRENSELKKELKAALSKLRSAKDTADQCLAAMQRVVEDLDGTE